MHMDEARDCVLLVLANKQDLPHAMSVTEVTEKMNLKQINQRWFVQACCAVSLAGIYEGFDRIASHVSPVPQ